MIMKKALSTKLFRTAGEIFSAIIDRKMSLLVPLVLFFSIIRIDLYAQQSSQSNFSISAPPLPWFEFQEGQSDASGTVNYFSLKGTDIAVTGAGGGLLCRYAFSNLIAGDLGLSVFGMNGKVSGLTMVTSELSVPFDLEFQVVNTQNLVFLLFGGFYLSAINSSLNGTIGTLKITGSTSGNMYGPQAGAQLSLKISDLAFCPFIMIQSMQGSMISSITVPGQTTISTKTKIPSYTITSYGFDLKYVPWNITLSSLLQLSPSAGQNQGYKMYLFGLTYRWGWGGKKEEAKKDEKAEMDKDDVKEKEDRTGKKSKRADKKKAVIDRVDTIEMPEQ
jgi:hypothetical protein